jgi:hypothetical protein
VIADLDSVVAVQMDNEGFEVGVPDDEVEDD